MVEDPEPSGSGLGRRRQDEVVPGSDGLATFVGEQAVTVVPTLHADLWLEPADLEEVQAAVDHVLANLLREDAPLKLVGAPTIGGLPICAAGANAPVAPREVRACFADHSLDLDPFPKFFEHAEILAADLALVRIALRPILAHEACHARQRARGDAKVQSVLDDAKRLSSDAKTSKAYSDYLIYLRNAAELAAHATQLAVEVRDAYGPGLGSSDFERRCRQSWLWRHLWKGGSWTPDPEDRGAAFKAYADELLPQSLWAYARLA